jgi:hypothetical protein
MPGNREAWPRSLWQKMKQHPVLTSVIVAIVICGTLSVVVTLGYLFHWAWTGLDAESHPNKDVLYQPTKTLWDWMQLLFIPLVLAFVGFVYNSTVSKNERDATAKRDKAERDAAATRDQTERQIAENNRQETTFQKG